jgi:hypothetical protein
MDDVRTLVGRQHRPNLLAVFLRAVGDRLYAGPDATARCDGLEITVRGFGLARTYRARALDHLTTCPRCAGARCAEYWLPACAVCGGRGRVARVAVTAGER